MKISIIGYKNHALRLKKCLNDQGYDNIFNYNHHKHEIKDILDSEIFLISSPNETHVDWIRKLSLTGKPIFCEKPPFVKEEDLPELEKYRRNLFFNFNYRFSYLIKIIENFENSKELGSIINIHCVSCHGLAFKPSYKNDWRFKSKNFFSSIVGNLGIHYIDLILYILKKPKSINIDYVSISSSKLPDTCKLNLIFDNSFADIFLSYSTAFQNKIEIFYENGILVLSNGEISLLSPRDTFDDHGFFKTPNQKILKKFINSRAYFDNSIVESLKYFMDHAVNKKNQSKKHYDQSILSTSTMLSLNKY